MSKKIVAICCGLLLVQPAFASVYGLKAGDEIGEIGFTTHGDSLNAGVSYDFDTGSLVIKASLLDITTSEGDVYNEIGGGTLGLEAQFVSESITPLGLGNGKLFLYTAIFDGVVTKADDGLEGFELAGPEQSLLDGGSDLLRGELHSELTIRGVLHWDRLDNASLQLRTEIDVTGGEPTFEALFGSSQDNDGTVVAGVGNFDNGGLGSLMTQSGGLFGVDGPQASFSFELDTGEITPTNPTPEPGTLVLLGLSGVLAIARRRLR